MAINKDEIDNKADEYDISPQNVEKDYIYGWVLHAIYTDPELFDLLILKGGNAFRKAYYENTRFSKDLDFSVETSISESLLRQKLEGICKVVTDMTGVQFDLNRSEVKAKNLPNKNLEVLEAKIYFKGFYNEEPIYLKTQLDVTQFDKIYLPTQRVPLIHPYSDSAECSTHIICQKSEEILASKLVALLKRRKVGDIFDLIHHLEHAEGLDISRREVVSTLLKRLFLENSPSDAKSLILDVPIEDLRPFWSQMIVPKQVFFEFDQVASVFSSLVDNLFSQFIATSQVAPLRYSGGYSPSAHGGVSSNYFSSSIRNTIIEAGRNLKMVELVYDGYRRLVEPYSIEYYIRKSDGVGNEYFWGYDTTGGKSGKQSIKRFFGHKIQSASISNSGFTPKYSVEF